jgi:hypothetical protein
LRQNAGAVVPVLLVLSRAVQPTTNGQSSPTFMIIRCTGSASREGTFCEGYDVGIRGTFSADRAHIAIGVGEKTAQDTEGLGAA